MSVINATPLLLGDDGYNISRSVRLRSSASASFTRTLSTPTDNRKWTLSGWFKLGATSSVGLQANNGSAATWLTLGSDGITLTKGIAGVSIAWNTVTAAIFRDFSAWYHGVWVFDSAQATASNRVKVYINGVQQTTSGSYPSLNDTSEFNSAIGHTIFNGNIIGARDGYLTEVNFIDGQALTPAAFGETDVITGVWKPKKYAGTYGTNGFFLNFSDPSAATAAAIGKDYSGNGNNWTPNNISVTAGTTYDSMLDVPTLYADGGNGRGNYAVVNPLSKGTSQTSVIDGNLYAIPTSGGSNWGTVFSSIAIPTSGKWYVEAIAQVYAGSGNSSSLGVVDSASFIPTNTATLYTFSTGEGFDGILAHLFSDYVSPIADGVQGTNVTGLTGTSINLMLALDVDNGKVYAGYNGTWLNSGNPAGNTGEVATRTFSASDVVAGHTSWNGTNDQSQYYNFGQRPFAYTPPTGFRALNTQNLPEPTIVQGNKWMDAKTYTGNGGTQTVSGMQFAPDFVWIKNRGTATDHGLFDTTRGATKRLASNLTSAETTEVNSLTAFTSNGFTVGATQDFNQNGVGLVAWQWKESASAGFDIVTFTAQSSGSATFSHSLGVAPVMIITKQRATAGTAWTTYHASVGNTGYLVLNTTAAAATLSTVWNNTSPTSSVFTLGSAFAGAGTMVAYLFAEVAGFSRFGSYTGNGSSDGPFVFCGFKPKFVMVKRTDATNFWLMMDTTRNTYNVMGDGLLANTSGAEFSWNPSKDILSNGFKVRTSDAAENANGGTYVYAAFSENPFKYSLAR
jgi:hypothetical protein